jgi:predicted nucleic acid-binding protein
MYLVGADHPNKHRARTIVGSVIAREDALVTDVEVLHRYAALRRENAIQPVFDIVLVLVDEVLPIELMHTQRAKELLLGDHGLSARDVLHLAVMEDASITYEKVPRWCRARIMTFDEGLDRYPGLDRIHWQRSRVARSRID